MKKIWLLTTLLVAGLLLTGCNKSVNVENEQERIFACGRSVSEYFGISDYSINWDKEEEAGASFVLNGRVNIGNGIDGEKITKNLQCVIDMVDKSVTILEIDEPVIEEVNIPTFEELNTVVAQCEVETLGENIYFEDLTRKDFLLPYKDGYLGFDGGGNNSDGRGYYLTYRTLENPCTIVSKTPAIFFWVRNKGNVYFATDLGTRVPQKKVKDLNCSIDNFSDCRDEMHKFMYHLIVGDETQEYFSQWITKFKDDIDKGIFRNWEYRHQKSIACNEKHGEINENDPDIWDKYDQFIQECIAEYLH